MRTSYTLWWHWWDGQTDMKTDCKTDTLNRYILSTPETKNFANGIKVLQLFADFKWDLLEDEQAPFIPNPDDIYDTGYFDAKNEARQFKLSDFKI